MGNKSSKKKKKQEEADAKAAQAKSTQSTSKETPEALPSSSSTDGDGLHNRTPSFRAVKTKTQSLNENTQKSVLKDSVTNSQSVTGKIISNIKDYYTYEDSDQLGKGHFGKVYRATNVQHGYVVALKIVSKKAVKGNRLASLQNEINIMMIMKHDNIVRLYEALEDAQNVYFAVEICTGGELFNAIVAQPEAHFTERVAASVAKDLLEGIHYCHLQNVAHRDLKPENIILSNNTPPEAGIFTEIKLIDFGLSRIYEDDTIMKSRVGTPYYIAPEVLERKYGKECDLWSAGVIIYILLCGYPPFRGDTDKEIYEEIQSGLLEFADDPGEHLWSVVSPDAIDFIQKLIVRNPSERLTAEQALEHKWIVELGPKDPQPLPATVMRRLARFAKENEFKQAAKRVIAGLLPSGEIENLTEIFKEFDVNGDGMLTLNELKIGLERKLLESTGAAENTENKTADSPGTKKLRQTTVQDAQLFLSTLDADGDGVVNIAEFVAATMKEQQYLTRQRIWQAFETFDTDGSQSLSANEVAKALGGDHLAKTIMKRFDSDGDGQISFEEFQEVMNSEE